MHKIDVDGGTKVLAEIKDLKEIAYSGLVATGPSYSGICSDKGIRVRSIKGKSVQIVGGANPSPDNPVAIQSVSIENFYAGKENFLTSEYIETAGQYIDETGNANIMSGWNISKYIEIPSGETKIRMSIEGTASAICFYTATKTFISGVGYYNSNEFTLPIPTNAKYLRYSMPDRNIGVAGRYVFFAHTESKSVTLRSLPNGVRDEWKDGKIIRRVGHIVFDGSSDENWTARGDGKGYAIVVPGALVRSARNPVLCNRGLFNSNDNDASKGVCVLGGSATISFFMGGESLDVTAWKTWLASNNLEVLYPLNEPTDETLSIPILPTQAPYAQAYTDSPVDTDILWEILTASNNDAQIEDLIARVTALESEAINA